MQRLMDYAKAVLPPVYRCWFSDAVFDRVYDIISPLIVGKIEEFVVGKSALNTCFCG